jgi:hypothetical protein
MVRFCFSATVRAVLLTIYTIWTTSPAEEKYTSYELEVLVIVKALKEFRAYLLDTPFKIVTECRAFIGTEEAKKGSLHTYYEVSDPFGRSRLQVRA